MQIYVHIIGQIIVSSLVVCFIFWLWSIILRFHCLIKGQVCYFSDPRKPHISFNNVFNISVEGSFLIIVHEFELCN